MVNKIDFIELYVGNALQAAMYYQHIWGFEVVAFKGLETGCRDHVSYLLVQNKIKLVITAALSPDNAIARHVALHGDGVKNIAFETDDVYLLEEDAKRKGAKLAFPTTKQQDKNGEVLVMGLKMYGDIIHTFIDRRQYRGIFMPMFEQKHIVGCKPTGLKAIDHITANVDRGKLDYWIDYYNRVFEFKEMLSFDETDVFTDSSAINTKVSTNPTQRIKIPIIQPINQAKNSQIQEFLDYNYGAGIQHIALLSQNIVDTVTQLSEKGVEFLPISQSYYNGLALRLEALPTDVRILQSLNIMIDKENDGWIYQAFTKPLVDRPTFFIEIIERKGGAKSFGKGNVKGLVESLELEQAKRGNL